MDYCAIYSNRNNPLNSVEPKAGETVVVLFEFVASLQLELLLVLMLVL